MSYITLAVAIILNSIFIPKHGAIGAAYATTISMWLSGIIGFIMYKMYCKMEL